MSTAVPISLAGCIIDANLIAVMIICNVFKKNDLIAVYRIFHGLVNIPFQQWGTILKFRPLNLSLTLQRISFTIEPYTSGTNFLIVLLPQKPLITSRKHFAV